MEVEESAEAVKKSRAERVGQIVGVPLVLALLVAAGILVASLFLGPKINPGPHASWLAIIFASRGVVGAVRVGIIFLLRPI